MLWIVLAAGLGVGVYGRVANYSDHAVVHYSTALGGPWLITAFAVGALVAGRRTRSVAAAAGAAALVLGTLTYYGICVGIERESSRHYAAAMVVGWCTACVPIGAAFAWLGAWWRSARGAVPAAVLAGALAGEALLLRLLWERPAALQVLHLEVLGAVLLALVLPRRRLPALALMVPVGLAVVVAEALVRESLRSVGWAGA